LFHLAVPIVEKIPNSTMTTTLFNVTDAIIVIGMALFVPYPIYCSFITHGIIIEGEIAAFKAPNA